MSTRGRKIRLMGRDHEKGLRVGASTAPTRRRRTGLLGLLEEAEAPELERGDVVCWEGEGDFGVSPALSGRMRGFGGCLESDMGHGVIRWMTKMGGGNNRRFLLELSKFEERHFGCKARPGWLLCCAPSVEGSRDFQCMQDVILIGLTGLTLYLISVLATAPSN